MEVKGIIKNILPLEEGTSKAGEKWKKLKFLISNNGGYKGKEQIFAFDVFGEKLTDEFVKYNKVGMEVEVSFNIRTNEYNGNYYTSLQPWKIYYLTSQENKEELSVDDDPFSEVF